MAVKFHTRGALLKELMLTEEEPAWFEEKREGLNMLYHGKYVLIKDRTLIGVCDREEDVFLEVGCAPKRTPLPGALHER